MPYKTCVCAYKARAWIFLLVGQAVAMLATARGGLAGDGRVYFMALPILALVGMVDSQRTQDTMRALLAGISQHRAKVVILDITGVPVVDSGVATRLKGARTIITGISDAVAESIVDLGIDWSGTETLSDLQTGLLAALGSMEIKLTRT